MYKNTQLTDNSPFLKEVGIMKFFCRTLVDYRTNLSKHHHEQYYEIGFIQNGILPALIFPSEEHSSDKAKYFELHGGDFIIFKPYALHSAAPNFPFNALTYWIQLDPECPRFLNLSEESTALLKKTLLNITQESMHIPQLIASHLTDAFQLLLNPTEANILRACSQLSLFIMETAELDEKYVIKNTKYQPLSPAAMEAIMFINNNLLNPDLNLATIAKHLQYSRSYTSTFFRQELGITLQEFLNHLKIKLACELLKNHSVTRTAMLLNFSSSQYFSNVFKRQMKMTPSEYRKSLF